MNEVQAKNYIDKIARSGRHESGLVIRILHLVNDDKQQAAQILQAVEIYVEHFKRPINHRAATGKNNQRRPSSTDPTIAKYRQVKATIKNPQRAMDRYIAKQKSAVVNKTKVWARDHLARPVVAAALRIVGMEMKK